MMDKDLISVALGQKVADIVIKNGKLVNVCTGEIYDAEVSIYKNKIAGIGVIPDSCIGEETKIISAEGKFLVPGFVDAHIHFESSMLAYTEFVNMVLRHGTTGVATDLMELTIVSGLAAVEETLKEASKLPVSLYYPVPSFMGDESEYQTTGSILSSDMIGKMLTKKEAVGLAEVLAPPILAGSDESARVLELAENMGKTAEGHAPVIMGKELNAYVSAGIRSDHESTNKEEALDKLRNGLRVLMREGSASTDLLDCLRIITEDHVDSRHCCMISDDIDALHIAQKGHMDNKIRMAIKAGVSTMEAYQMATINPSESLKIDNYAGSITPGKFADIVIISDLEQCAIDKVIAKGNVEVDEGLLTKPYSLPSYSPIFLNTIKIGKTITGKDLVIKQKNNAKKAEVHVIGASPVNLLTTAKKAVLSVDNGFINCDVSKDILYLACIERYGKGGGIGKSFIEGFKMKSGAIATSVGHDHHNVTVLGSNPDDMAIAVNRISELNGGLVLVDGGKVLEEIPLPIAGLLSDCTGDDVASRLEKLLDLLKERGCDMGSPFMTLAFITLIFIPDFGITDKGLFDVNQFKIIDPVIEWK